MAEIAEEVRLRRTSGDLPPKLERELDELFLAHSPVAGRGGDLGDALRMVDAATFIDPVVPVESERAAGAAVKKGMRSLLLWYVGWLTHQMSQSASAVSRALHIVDDRLQELERQVESQSVPPAGVVEFPALLTAEAWWVGLAVAAVAKAPGRILHVACGDGWLVRRVVAAGGDAYGVDPRPRLVDNAELGGLDLRVRACRGASPSSGPGRSRRRRAERHGRRHGRHRAGPAPGIHRDAVGARRNARGALGDQAGLGVRRRPSRGGSRARRPAATRAPGADCWSGAVTRRWRMPARQATTFCHRRPVRHRVAVHADGAVSAAAGAPVAVHQFIATLNPHDATGTHALKLRDALRDAGWRSEIFAEAIHDDLASEAFKHWMYPEHAAPGDVAIYQFTTSSAVAGYLAEQGLPLILDFHNFTGPEYFAGWEPRSVRACRGGGRRAGAAGTPGAARAGQEPFQRAELRRAGCRRTAVVPVLADYGRVTGTPDPRVAAELARLAGRWRRPTSSSSGGSCPPRRSTNWSRRCGPTVASTTPRPACTWSAARRASSTPRPCRASWTTSASALPYGCRARCRTPRWRPTSRRPTSTSRCRPTRGSGSRSSRRWWPESPSSPEAPAPSRDTVADAALVLAAADPSYIAAALHRVCTDERLRATLTAAGARRAAELSGDAPAVRTVEAVAAVGGRA